MSYRCRICGETWTEIPPDAVEISATRRGARRGRLYKFGHAIHDLRIVPKLEPETPIMANPEPPVVHIELVQEVQAPVPEQNLPVMESQEVAQLEKLPEPEIENELMAITSLAAVFRRAERRK
jgi:hypothetical protein